MQNAKRKKRIPRRATYRQQGVRCGREKCARCGDGVPRHGPYWFAYWRTPGGRSRSAYIGHELPEKLANFAIVTTADGRRVTARHAREIHWMHRELVGIVTEKCPPYIASKI